MNDSKNILYDEANNERQSLISAADRNIKTSSAVLAATGVDAKTVAKRESKIGVHFNEAEVYLEKKSSSGGFLSSILNLSMRKKTFKNMTDEEKKERINYLWDKLRESVKTRSITKFVETADKNDGRINLGLDSSVDYELSEAQQLEEELVYEDDGGFNDLAWYLVNPESNISKFQNVQVQMMTWCTLLLTPLLILFK